MKHHFICTDLSSPEAVSVEVLLIHMKLACIALSTKHITAPPPMGSTDCGSCVILCIDRILVQLSEEGHSCGWFQHDMSASHTTDHSLTALEKVLGDCKMLWLMTSKFAALCPCALYL